MKATIYGLSALLLTMTLTTVAQAWYGYGPPPPVNAFTPSCCPYWDQYSCASYNNWPPCSQPFQGFRPPTPPFGNNCIYRFARSPRDYFMVDP